MNVGSLAGKSVLVAGGTRGIGLAIVNRLVDAGAQVVYCGRTVDAASPVLGGAALALACDVTDAQAVDALFQRVGPLDAVVCNAGLSREALLVSTNVTDWDQVMRVNLTGTFLIARHAVRQFLRDERHGSIICLGSLAQHGTSSNASYSASKGGVAGLVEGIAAEYASWGIRANAVVAGYVETDMTSRLSSSARVALVDRCPQRRSARSSEVANVVAFLASDASRGLSGGCIHVAGGMREMPF